jgi:DNA-binding response OmpR family regulator
MRALIVEDDAGSRGILEEHLRARGWDALCAANPGQAERLLEQHGADVVLTDIHLPGASGTEHIRRLCAWGETHAGAAPLVVVMTGFPSLETCLDSIQAGAAGYLVKPFRVAEFAQLAERALAERERQARADLLEARVHELEQELSRLRAAPGVSRPGAPGGTVRP